jgi:hypothetical protein
MFDDEPKPQRNDQLIKLYGLLCSLITSLTPEITKLNLRDGTGEKLNGYIDELIVLTNDTKLNDFKVPVYPIQRTGGRYVMGEAYVRQLSGLVNYLWSANDIISYYGSSPPDVKYSKSGSSPTFNNQIKAEQKTHQTTNVHIEFTQTIVSVTEALTNLEHDYPDESTKENKFAKAIKKSLPKVKDTLGIVSLVLTVASELGLDPKEVLKFLGLS